MWLRQVGLIVYFPIFYHTLVKSQNSGKQISVEGRVVCPKFRMKNYHVMLMKNHAVFTCIYLLMMANNQINQVFLFRFE